MKFICGIDEAGFGTLLGPLFVSGVILEKDQVIPGVKDSKKIKSVDKMVQLWLDILKNAKFVSLRSVDSKVIDSLGVRKAWDVVVTQVMLDCQQECMGVPIVVDGSRYPRHKSILGLNVRAESKADSKYMAVSAASIVAKANQIMWMERFGLENTQFTTGTHRGYGTMVHLEEIKKHGYTQQHRRSFKTKI